MDKRVEIDKTVKVNIGEGKAMGAIVVIGPHNNSYGKKTFKEWIAHVIKSPDFDEIKVDVPEEIDDIIIKKGAKAFFVTDFCYVKSLDNECENLGQAVALRRVVNMQNLFFMPADKAIEKELTDKTSIIERDARVIRDDFYAKKSGHGKIYR